MLSDNDLPIIESKHIENVQLIETELGLEIHIPTVKPILVKDWEEAKHLVSVMYQNSLDNNDPGKLGTHKYNW